MGRNAFFEGRIVPINKARVSVMPHGLNSGNGCSEGSAGDFLRVRHGHFFPVRSDFLEGLVRDSIFELALEQHSIDRSEVHICEESLLTGTDVQVAAKGRTPKYRHWCIPVFALD